VSPFPDWSGTAYDAIPPVESEADLDRLSCEEGPVVNGLDERRVRAVAVSQRLFTNSNALLDVAAQLRSRATELRIAASHVRFRAVSHDGDPASWTGQAAPWFTVRGVVDGRPTSARWWPGHLACEHEVLQRMHVIVAMDERFTAPWAAATDVAASLDGLPLAVLLTVMRAFSRVTSIDLSVALISDIDTSHHG